IFVYLFFVSFLQLRENCLKRIRDDRAKLLRRLRLSGKTPTTHKEIVASTFKEILSDELEKIKESSFIDCKEISVPHVDDLVWDYSSRDVAYVTTENEYIDLMLEMERLLRKDIEEQLIVKDIAENEDFENVSQAEEDYIIQSLEHLQLRECQKENFWCPICTKGCLQEKLHFIYCRSCNLQLDIQSDKVDLDYLRMRLGEVLDEHLDKGCHAKPEFCMENRFGLSALYLRCYACNSLEIVL
ncbi:uncharacterized protein LOC18448590, partial [Amborella trichopoda]|uniref:uncharacterized protein LOC18448590 n=1 Tax=Amborella trichopoda TaxID=13333 RepID=UPI0009C0480E